ncbi:MAG: hypothetical protein ACI8TX_001980 [Hyphomicrobiaceae bacterium]|jgi:hypothetical protein
MNLTLVLPPLTQLNTPYPSISYLAQHLRSNGVGCHQRDLGIELVHTLFSRKGLEEIFDELEAHDELPEPAWRVLGLRNQHLRAVEPVLAFLQGTDRSLASRILETPFLPSGPRLAQAQIDAFGSMGTDDAARHLATLYLDDLADLVTSCIDEGFGITRYQAHLAGGGVGFDPLWQRLGETTLVDRHLDALADTLCGDVGDVGDVGNIVGLSVPFPGNLYGALRIGQRLRERGIHVLLGGGYVNTELRDVNEPRLWECVDTLTYDDGEGPLLAILEHLDGGVDRRHRTRTKEGMLGEATRPTTFVCAPHYGDLNLDLYLDTVDTLNPAHRLWADGRWNKITIAHGCYWKRCTFCDVSLDYIGHYQQAETVRLVDEIERVIAETGQTGFHFVDEAAPPAALKALAIELLARNLGVTLWGNIRFEKAFTPDLCRLLAAAGVVAVTGGLEVASDRLLEAMDKGVTIEQVARAARAFREAGIMVHAYLMYGFPTQTVQETIDSMEIVRQLFAADLVSSGFWHRFVLTRHAPMFTDPARFGLEIADVDPKAFARNDIAHRDPRGADHDRFDEVLPLALEAWMQGEGFDQPVHSWFEETMPASQEPSNRIETAIAVQTDSPANELVWLGGTPLVSEDGVLLVTTDAELFVPASDDEIAWLCDVIERASPGGEGCSVAQAIESFPGQRADWEYFSGKWGELRTVGLVAL